MSKKETGGPAFPFMGMDFRNGQQVQSVYQNGMSMRDYFAAHAPAAPDDWSEVLVQRGTYVDDAMAAALWSFEYADAMLEVREE